MDDMLQSPSSFNIPSIGTPHHPMEEDHMINPQAQAKQESKTQNDGEEIPAIDTDSASTTNMMQQQ